MKKYYIIFFTVVIILTIAIGFLGHRNSKKDTHTQKIKAEIAKDMVDAKEIVIQVPEITEEVTTEAVEVSIEVNPQYLTDEKPTEEVEPIIADAIIADEIQVEVVPFEEEAPEERPHLTKQSGVFAGPSGKETYYNLNMSRCVSVMRGLGYDEETYPVWTRGDGAKMLGDYVMCAASFDIRPRGTILETSLGMAIVVDTGTFAYNNQTQIDLCVTW